MHRLTATMYTLCLVGSLCCAYGYRANLSVCRSEPLQPSTPPSDGLMKSPGRPSPEHKPCTQYPLRISLPSVASSSLSPTVLVTPSYFPPRCLATSLFSSFLSPTALRAEVLQYSSQGPTTGKVSQRARTAGNQESMVAGTWRGTTGQRHDQDTEALHRDPLPRVITCHFPHLPSIDSSLAGLAYALRRKS